MQYRVLNEMNGHNWTADKINDIADDIGSLIIDTMLNGDPKPFTIKMEGQQIVALHGDEIAWIAEPVNT